MGKVLTFAARDILAGGLNKSAWPKEEEIQRYFFDDDYHNLKLLKKILPLNSPTEKPILLYPGCGDDVLFPLYYLDYLFPGVKEAHFILVDVDSSLNIIKTVLDDVGVTFSEKKKSISFYWRNKLIHLKLVEDNIFELIQTLPTFDIYFEKAFRIMKDDFPEYENEVCAKLRPGGILISDSGFQNVSLDKIAVPNELSVYNEMIIGIKR